MYMEYGGRHCCFGGLCFIGITVLPLLKKYYCNIIQKMGQDGGGEKYRKKEA